MGIGDNVIATGMARGASARGKKVAFGDGSKIIWDQHSRTIFAGNPNIAVPGTQNAPNLEWIAFHKGNRIYNSHDKVRNKWVWNYEFRPKPGEIFFTRDELKLGRQVAAGVVFVEPNVPEWKSSAPNKQWPVDRYAEVCRRLQKAGYDVRQLSFKGRHVLPVVQVSSPSFRVALSILRRARMYIGPEGGMHHGAAAVGLPAVVLFGGFIPPQVTGYDTHANLAGTDEFCGSLTPCQHCRDAMSRITVDEVVEAALRKMKR